MWVGRRDGVEEQDLQTELSNNRGGHRTEALAAARSGDRDWSHLYRGECEPHARG